MSASFHGNEFYTNLAPAIWCLKLLGVMPLQRTSTGCLEFVVRSPIMLYSMLVYCIMLAVLYMYLKTGHSSEVFSDHNNFDSSLYTYYSFILGIPVLVTPLFFWSQAPGIAHLFTRWDKFQETYRRLTGGEKICLGLYQRSVVLAITVPLISLAVELFYAAMGFEDWREFATVVTYFTYVSSVRGVLVALWYFECAAICRVSTQLLAIFNDGAISYPSCRAIWLELSRLAAWTGVVAGYTYGFYIVYLFVVLTITMYELVNRFVGDLHLEWGNLWIITESVVICLVLYVICESADNVTFNLKTRFRTKLVHLKTTSTRNSKDDKEIQAFIELIKVHPPLVTLAGYVTLNRGVLVTLVSMLVTYLVVLLQLKMSSTAH